MAGVYGNINSRADFQTALHRALAEGKAFQAKFNGDATINAVVQQLESIERWTANGRTPAAYRLRRRFAGRAMTAYARGPMRRPPRSIRCSSQ